MSVTVNTTSGTQVSVSVNGTNAVSFTTEETTLNLTEAGAITVSVTEKGPKGDVGAIGPTGATGPAGPGLASGGTENQFIQKNSATDYDTKWSAYTLPGADGDEGTVLTTDGAGTVSFAHPQTIAENVKNVSGGILYKGTPVHVTGSVGNLAEVIAADAATNYPAHFVLNEDLNDDEEGLGIALGFINNVDVPDASIYTEGQTVYLGAAGGWVTSKPTGASNAIQNLGIIIKVNTGGNKISGIVMGAGRANDVPNIATGNIWAGNSSGVATATDTAYIDIANGRVGIGTTSPDSILHVSADVSSPEVGTITIEGRPVGYLGDDIATIDFHNTGTKRADIRMERGNASNDSQLVFSTSDAGTLTDRLIINEAGNVGIGTTAPTFANGSGLEIERAGIATLRLQDTTNVANAELQSGESGLHVRVGANGSSGNLFNVSSAGTSRLLIDISGNVGIGTTSPSAKLDVSGEIQTTSGGSFGTDGVSASIFMNTTDNRGLSGRFTTYARNLIKSDGTATIEIGENSSLISLIKLNAGSSGVNGVVSFLTKNSERMRVAADGNVGIGTTSPARTLDVKAEI